MNKTNKNWNFPDKGNLLVPMTNDYLFKALLQENEHVLRGLLCSLLHLKEDEIISTEITNSIILGETITEKTFMLDVKINLNNAKTIALEMQVINYDNWPERSLAYLGREFSKIVRGSDYGEITPVHQIGILNFSIFNDAPSFYSTYMMQDVITHKIYSDKFKLSVLDLTQIDSATEEDKSYKLDHWARLFSAKTWEDLNMLAKENPLMAEANDTIRRLTEASNFVDACMRREEELKRETYMKRKIEEQAAEIEEQATLIENLKRQLAAEKAKNQ